MILSQKEIYRLNRRQMVARLPLMSPEQCLMRRNGHYIGQTLTKKSELEL